MLSEFIWKEHWDTCAPDSMISRERPLIRMVVSVTDAPDGISQTEFSPIWIWLWDRSTRRPQKRLNFLNIIIGNKATQSLAVYLASPEEITTLHIESRDVINPINDVVELVRQVEGHGIGTDG